MSDQAKFGEALARVMDRRDKLADAGHLDGFVLDEIIVVAAFIRPHAEADQEIEPDAMESLILVDGSTQIPHRQVGVLTMALDTAVNPI